MNALHLCPKLSARAPKASLTCSIPTTPFFNAWLPKQSPPLRATVLLQSTLKARCMDQCMVAVGTWSPRTHVEARICPGDGIEVDWKQPVAEGGFWAWGLVHPASGASRACGAQVGPRSPRWGYFPLSCVPPQSLVESAVDEYHF